MTAARYSPEALKRLGQVVQAIHAHRTDEDYRDARKRLIVGLAAAGWTVNDFLKSPKATPPGGSKANLRLYFHKQCVRYKIGKWSRNNKARSLFRDIRGLSVDDLIQEAKLLEVDFL